MTEKERILKIQEYILKRLDRDSTVRRDFLAGDITDRWGEDDMPESQIDVLLNLGFLTQTGVMLFLTERGARAARLGMKVLLQQEEKNERDSVRAMRMQRKQLWYQVNEQRYKWAKRLLFLLSVAGAWLLGKCS